MSLSIAIVSCYALGAMLLLAFTLHVPINAAPGQIATAKQPVKIILDTDMGYDIDDALALAVVHALQNRNACELLAVTLTCPEPLAAEFVAAVNLFYGRPKIPIGINPDAPVVRHPNTRYLEIMLRQNPDGSRMFPLPGDWDASRLPRAVTLLRRTLASAADSSIVIIQIGFSTNLAALLDTPPDGLSPLNGRDLVAKKVRLLSIMSSEFSGEDKQDKFNILFDVPAARKLADEWPTPIVWGGAEVGIAVRYPARSIDHDFFYHPNHPIREAYQSYRPTPHERPCWDPISVLHAVWPDRPYYTLSPKGRVTVTPDRRTPFVEHPDGRDRYLKVDALQIARLREVISLLASEPPKTKDHSE